MGKPHLWWGLIKFNPFHLARALLGRYCFFMSKILIVTNCHASNIWTAYVYLDSVLQTEARNTDEDAAVRDAVAKFRTARGCRKAG